MKILVFLLLGLASSTFICGYAVISDDPTAEEITDDISEDALQVSNENTASVLPNQEDAQVETPANAQQTPQLIQNTEVASEDERVGADAELQKEQEQGSGTSEFNQLTNDLGMEGSGSGGDKNENQEEAQKETENPSENTEEKAKSGASEKEVTEEEEAPLNEKKACEIKFKKIGCYKSKNKARGFKTFLQADQEADSFAKKGKVANKETFNKRLPNMVCECAKAALNSGNAIFSLKNIAECWTGPDSTIYDAEGPSDKCVTFGSEKCDENSELCSGKKHSNFVYFVDSPDHTKSAEEIKKELAAENKRKAKQAAKEAKKAEKSANKNKKKHKKSKKGKGKKKHE